MIANVGRLVGRLVGWLVGPLCISRTKHIQKEMEIRAEPPWAGGVHGLFFLATPIFFSATPIFLKFFFCPKYRFLAFLDHLEQKNNFHPYKKKLYREKNLEIFRKF